MNKRQYHKNRVSIFHVATHTEDANYSVKRGISPTTKDFCPSVLLSKLVLLSFCLKFGAYFFEIFKRSCYICFEITS